LHAVSTHARQRVLAVHLQLHPAADGLNSLEQSWKKPLLVLLAAAAGLLLIACLNLAGLLMVRASARQREIAIRRSVGATRRQIVLQLLSESVLLALIGSVLGIFLSLALTRGILHMLPPDAGGGWITSGLNWPVIGTTLLVSAVAGLAFGLFPAWQVSAENAASTLKDQGRQAVSGAAQTQWRRALIVFEIALCVVLLAGAGLFTKSFVKLLHHNPGFHTENLETFTVDPALSRYTTAQALNLYSQIEQRLAGLPGTTAVSFCHLGPYSGDDSSTNVSVEGYHAREDENMDAGRNLVAPGFFRTIGIRLLSGREFTAADVPNAQKTAIVNEAFVKRFIRGRDAVGTNMSIGGGKKLDIEIVGVVPDAQLGSLRDTPKPFYYLPFLQPDQLSAPAPQAVFLVRTRNDDASLPAAIRQIVNSLDRSLPVTSMEKVQVRIQNSVYRDRAVAVLTSTSGFLALLLASLGLYGVVAYSVSRRTAEIGIRMALGARRESIFALILLEVMWMIAAGVAIGVIAGLGLTRALASQLFGVAPADISVFAGAVAVLFAVALLAGAIPTLRAARVDPMSALRYD
ncbi:MAG: FtsX-like permease family protein, partial [Acidobacteriaceae bacterium]|nr:FtsX-like permease family protein [Acidobacteriaceae bacterium]